MEHRNPRIAKQPQTINELREASPSPTSNFTTELKEWKLHDNGTEADTDLWDQMEDSGISPHTCAYLVFDKESKIYTGEKDSIFSKHLSTVEESR